MRNEIKNLSLPLPIAIVGMGLTGTAVLKLLLAAGLPREQILTFDQKGNADGNVEFQDPKVLLLNNPGTLCVSPGVPLKSPWIQDALNKGLRLTSELEIAFSFLTTETVVAITGSIGKSTVTALVGEAVLAQDEGAFVGGNLGTPLAAYSLRLITEGAKRAEFVILELSSYQLENFKNLQAKIGILTYLSPNHLERYSSLQEYFETKKRLFAQVTSTAIVNNFGGNCAASFPSLRARFPALDWILTDQNDLDSSLQAGLVGAHNRDNLSLAYAAAKTLRLSQNSYERMLQFQGLPHRMENCGLHQKVLFINDSKATSMDSVLQAYHSILVECSGNIHLLLGGRDKNLPWEKLKVLTSEDRLRCSFFGEFGSQIKQKTQLPGSVSLTLKTCLDSLKSQLESGDLVLLSPGGTSLDEFKNFEDRGDFFKSWVLSEFHHHEI